jgi:glycosyltransferase involved in cell wall biosynthesis
MKLLIYSHDFAPSIGGVETIVLSLVRGLASLRTADGKEQFDLTLVTETPAGEFEDRSLPFPVARQPSLPALWRLIRAADVVHVAGPSLAPLFLARLGRRPVVLEHHGYQAICPNGVLLHQPDRAICPGHFQAGRYGECLRCQATEMSVPRSWVNLLLMFARNFLSRGAACNIAISQHVLERHALPRSSVVYYGIDNLSGEEFSTSSRVAGKMCFAYVGRLVAEKGLPILLQAAQILQREGHEFEILLIGDGPERAKLEAVIERTGLNDCASIAGFLQGAAFVEMLGRVNVVVMPSVWEETAGLAAIEQMMRARLVIAARIGGLGEIVGDAGLTCLPGNPEDLARCMREVLQDPSKVATIGCEARERARSLFLRERMIADHARLYLELGRVADR